MEQFSEEEVATNLKNLEELKKLPYETLLQMRKEILSNPNSKRIDILNIVFASGEKEIELGIPGHTLDEVMKELLGDNYLETVNSFRWCKIWFISNSILYF